MLSPLMHEGGIEVSWINSVCLGLGMVKRKGGVSRKETPCSRSHILCEGCVSEVFANSELS